MAKSSFLIRQLFQNRAAKAARGRLENTHKQNCPKLTTLVLILLVVMLGCVFLAQAIV